MSQVQKIEEMIFSNFKEGDIVTTTIIQRLAVQNGIISEDNNTAVNNTFFSLRNDIRLKKIERGRYQITCENLNYDDGESTERLFEQLISRLKKYKTMNPVNDDKVTVLKAAEEVDKYRKYIKILQNFMDNK